MAGSRTIIYSNFSAETINPILVKYWTALWCKAKLSGLTTNLFDCFIRYADKFQCISPEVPCNISLSNIQYFGKNFPNEIVCQLRI